MTLSGQKQGIPMKLINRLIETGLISLIMAPGAVFAQDNDQASTTDETAAAETTTAAENTASESETAASASDATQAAGDATQAAGDAIQAAGDATQAAGDATQAAGADGAAANAGSGTEAAKAASEPAEGALPEPETLTEKTLDKTLHEVSTSVDTLKEDTFSTKSRLLLLREEVLQRSVSGARLLIRHKDDMGNQFEMIEIHYLIDNKPAFSQVATGDGVVEGIDDEIVFDENTSPGTHQVSVKYIYRGKKWGVFSYMHHYSFVVESGYSFVLEEGKSAELTITAAEQGNAFTAYEKRPTVEYKFEQFNLAADSASTATVESK